MKLNRRYIRKGFNAALITLLFIIARIYSIAVSENKAEQSDLAKLINTGKIETRTNY